jgi:hypothetical protein
MVPIQFVKCVEHALAEMAGDLDLPADYIVRYLVTSYFLDSSGWLIPSEVACAAKWRRLAEEKYPQLLVRFTGDAWRNRPLAQSRLGI